MTDKTPSLADPLGDAITRALDAAAAATDAAHEAEAVLAARSEAALSMDRTARRSGWLAALAGGASVLVLVLGGLLWLRTSADLRDAGAVQAAASVAFVERLAEFNAALDRLDLMGTETQTASKSAQAEMTALVGKLDARLDELMALSTTPPATDQALATQIDTLRTDMIEAIAETQLSIAEHMGVTPVQAPVAPVPAAASRQVSPPVAAAPSTAKKPAPRPTPAAQPINPFRYP